MQKSRVDWVRKPFSAGQFQCTYDKSNCFHVTRRKKKTGGVKSSIQSLVKREQQAEGRRTMKDGNAPNMPNSGMEPPELARAFELKFILAWTSETCGARGAGKTMLCKTSQQLQYMFANMSLVAMREWLETSSEGKLMSLRSKGPTSWPLLPLRRRDVLNEVGIRWAVSQGCNLQLHSDGGHRSGRCSAAAWVLHAYMLSIGVPVLGRKLSQSPISQG